MQAPPPIVPTPEQIAICQSTHPRLLVEANAGTAKTTTAALKIAHLVAHGVNPSRIVALSFSRPGVQAFHDAFRRIGMDADVAATVRVGTVEDFCAARLFRLENLKVPRPVRPEDVRPHVLQAVAEARAWADDRYPGAFALEGSGRFAVEGLLKQFARIKGALAISRAGEYFNYSPASVIEAELEHDFTTLAIFRAYERLRCQFVDGEGEHVRFRYAGDATYDLAQLLGADDPPFTQATHPLRLGLQAVVLDEMHDTHWAMFTVIKGLLERNEGCTFLGVGDRDQVIHAQEGADAFFMNEGFDLYIGTPQRLRLTEAFRFGEAIARPLSGHARKAYPASARLQSVVEVRRIDTAVDLLALLHEALASRRGLSPSSPASQLAVLLRHPNAAVDLEYGLLERNLAYETRGFTTFLARPEVLLVRMLLAAAVSQPRQFMAPVLLDAKLATWEFIGGALPHQAEQGESTEKIVTGSSQANFFSFILPALLQHTENADARERVLQAMALASSDAIAVLPAALAALDIRTMARRVFVKQDAIDATQASLDGLLRAAQGYGSITAFLDRLLHHDYSRLAKKTADQRITLSAIEDAKGLEFDHVVLPEVNQGAFDGTAGDDRNLFYVAASRARNVLTLTHRSGQASSYLRHFG